MMPNLNDVMAPDMQKILFFMVPFLIFATIFVMNLSRGFSTAGMVGIVIFGAIAVFFFPGFLSIF